MEKNEGNIRVKKNITSESFIFLGVFFLIFGLIARKMGLINMVNTLMNTSYSLLINTVLYIMAIAVLMGALSELLLEFGVVALVNKLLSPIIKPIYDMPGASTIAIFSTYFSDNPAILPLAKNRSFKSYFKKYQFYALANLGTAFGMGLITSAFIIGIKGPGGERFISSVVIGNIGAIIGSIVSARMMLHFTKKIFGREDGFENIDGVLYDIEEYREIRQGSSFSRFLSAAMEGGMEGVKMGVEIIPGVLVICTIVLILTFGPGPDGVYTGSANEGIELLPYLGDKLHFILRPIFGFENSANVAVPITALGAAGAAIALIPKLVQDGLTSPANLAVLTAMCMCWSGYLSTHVAMMDSLGRRDLAGSAIFSHTIGGLVAGFSANLIFKLYILI